jgi:hypothetical protein
MSSSCFQPLTPRRDRSGGWNAIQRGGLGERETPIHNRSRGGVRAFEFPHHKYGLFRSGYGDNEPEEVVIGLGTVKVRPTSRVVVLR